MICGKLHVQLEYVKDDPYPGGNLINILSCFLIKILTSLLKDSYEIFQDLTMSLSRSFKILEDFPRFYPNLTRSYQDLTKILWAYYVIRLYKFLQDLSRSGKIYRDLTRFYKHLASSYEIYQDPTTILASSYEDVRTNDPHAWSTC